RATIHLDMVFTMIDRDAALIYQPVILGSQKNSIYRIDAGKGGKLKYREVDSLLLGLKEEGIDLEPVLCGKGHHIYQQREQWLSGANSFAFAPGKILMYSCNQYTVEALADAGFAVVDSKAFIDGADNVANYGRLAVTFDGIELARGGGGARCMTLPVEREPVKQ
ncbi:MAG: arginine deiminase family protein, partial [Rectinemataceae bacterium]